MLICAVSRAPLLPIGSLSTCTIKAWPSKIWRSIGSAASGAGKAAPALAEAAAGLSLPAWRAAMLGIRSATCRKAARSSPMSMKADCMPGSTRETLPR